MLRLRPRSHMNNAMILDHTLFSLPLYPLTMSGEHERLTLAAPFVHKYYYT